ncbi:synaptonemal complex central element protein 3 [Cottoperca gobio]|uniref:Synaptonemal complex central element protein 3 n=1 Tax=Cottoperca gobio TaxID=56716 RepID=A0A6J2QIU7_COTGO|nr:synaptonemal complex central element protein 3 [Cottoperca gobio]
MAHLSSLPELQQGSIDDVLQVNKDLESTIEAVEHTSVQLTWMGYDMVALRTSPELGTSMQKLEEAYNRCRVVICGDREQPESDMGI